MKSTFKTVLGVTLLEIMLVLAIAAMIIVMSIRYYQSSTSAQQVNAAMEQVQALASAMDNIANGGAGSYSSITSSTLAAVVGSTNMYSATNQPITFTPISGTQYSITMPLNPNACTSVAAKLASNTKIVSPVCDGTTGALTYTYDSSL